MKLALLILSAFGAVVLAALGELLSEEIRARLDRIPFAMLRAASRRVPPDQRTELYEHAWLPELHYVLQGDEAMPITRLIHGIRYAARLWLAAPSISRELAPESARQKLGQKVAQAWQKFYHRQPEGTYADLFLTWGIFSTLIYVALMHNGAGKITAFCSWAAVLMIRSLVIMFIMRHRGQSIRGRWTASWPEAVTVFYFILPALTLWAAVTAVTDIWTLATGHGSIGTYLGLTYSLLVAPFPWVEIHMAKAHRDYRESVGAKASQSHLPAEQ